MADTYLSAHFRPRRSHHKSRNGCVRCKQQRKKCDEVRPRCSRCADGDYRCEFPPMRRTPSAHRERKEPSPDSLSYEFASLTAVDDQQHQQQHQQYFPPQHHSPPSAGGFFSTSSPLQSPPPSWTSGTNDATTTSTPLNATELQLLSHFITHTSVCVAFDAADLFTLQVGVPNLAFTYAPLMSSAIALAATCRCNDIITSSGGPGNDISHDDISYIAHLLALADRRHACSLEQTQAAIANTERYDHVLATATVMVLYASASHSVRIRLARIAAARYRRFPAVLAPTQYQWISFIRAAHAAYTGLICDPVSPQEMPSAHYDPASSQVPSPQDGDSPSRTDDAMLSPEDGPTKETRELLLPILAATWRPALDALRAQAQSVQAASMNLADGELATTMAAIDVLTSVFDTVFASKSPTTSADVEFPGFNVPPIGRLSQVHPWLRDYLARVTSVSSSPDAPLRRSVMSFINKVSLEYLSVVQLILGNITTHPGAAAADDSDYDDTADTDADAFFPSHSAARQLAMDAFAHWLVLVLLLDGVWWIGGIGQWELEKVVAFMRKEGWVGQETQAAGSWWPESMLRVRMEIDRSVGVGGAAKSTP